MSVQRYIDTGLWLDDWFVALPTPDKLLYVYLLTNPQTNIAGIYKTTVRLMHNETGLPADDIEAILAGFALDEKAYFLHGLMILPAWPDHQKWETKTSIKKGIDSILDTLSAKVLETLSVVGYRYPSTKIPTQTPYQGGINPPSRGDQPPINQHEPTYSDSDSDSDSDSELHEPPTEGGSRGEQGGIDPHDPRGRQITEALAGIKAGLEGQGEDW